VSIRGRLLTLAIGGGVPLLRPVRRLSFAADQFGEGHFSARAPSGGRDVISRLGTSFNAMAERLEKREARAEGARVMISARDNGRGIPPEDMPVLFDKFHRGRPAPHSEAMRGATTDAEFLEDADASGVGLGLYLGRNVMEQMGGRIGVESEVGRGSTFTLYLPVWRAGGCGKQLEGEDGNGKTVTGR